MEVHHSYLYIPTPSPEPPPRTPHRFFGGFFSPPLRHKIEPDAQGFFLLKDTLSSLQARASPPPAIFSGALHNLGSSFFSPEEATLFPHRHRFSSSSPWSPAGTIFSRSPSLFFLLEFFFLELPFIHETFLECAPPHREPN